NPREHWSVSHEGRWRWGTSNLAAYQETTRQIDYNEGADGHFTRRDRAPDIRNRTLDAKLAMPLGAHNLVVGGQWRDGRLIDQNPGRRDGENARFSIEQKAVFAEDEWRLGERFALTGGV